MSKRGMDMQGGEDRYGGPRGSETPVETPTKATAAQLARRKIATLKSRSSSRTPAPASAPSAPFGGFDMSQSGASQPSSGFSFGQTGNSTPSTGFGFGQSQPTTSAASNNTGFSFGSQAQSAGSNSFTFGQSAPSQNGGFTFGAKESSSFPPSGSNPFSSSNGTSNANSGSTAFSGSIFNFNSSQPQSQPASNGFAFGASTAAKPAEMSGPSEADKQEIARREPYLNPAQQKRLEEIIGAHLPDSPAAYQKDPLDYLPANVVSQVVEYLKTLSPPSFGATANVESLFVKPYRSKAKKAWVTDAEREEFKQAAGKLSPADQEKLAQVVKNEVDSLKGKANHELPSVEYLPNDTQRHMIEVAKSASDPPKQTSTFGQNAPATPASEPKTAQSPAAEGTPTANPFASIKFNPTPAPKTPSAGFSFGSSPAPAAATPNGAPKAPSFSFGNSTPAKTDETAAPPKTPSFSFMNSSSATKDATPAAPPKTPTFSFGQSTAGKENERPAMAPKTPSFSFASATPAKQDPAPASAPKTPTFSFASATPAKKDDTPAAAPSFSFLNSSTPAQSQQAAPVSPAAEEQPKGNPFASVSIPKTPQQAAGPQPSTPAPKFDFARQTAKTPAPAPSNVFSTPSAQPPATAPVQKSMSAFSFGSTAPVTKQPSFTGFGAQSATAPSNATKPVATSNGSTAHSALQKFNVAFKKHLDTLESSDDWSHAMKFYLSQTMKLKQAAKAQSSAPKSSQATSATKTPAPSTPKPAQPVEAPSFGASQQETAQKPKPTPGFQLNSPQKPLSATANLFSNILDSPDKPSATAEGSAVPKIGFGLHSPFKPAAGTTPPAAPVPSVPKFGNAAPGASTSNFMSAFGASAAKQADKDKAKRKAEDFDSDEDDEAEWERQDKEKQEAKRKALEEAAKSATTFKFQPTTSSAPAAAPTFSAPKFGTATSGSSTNFLSAFGASAAKEADKEKAKRKAEDFDSDEDDEAEWERQDKEKQEAKRKALEQSANKVMKNVNGKFEWVEVEKATTESPAQEDKAASPPKTNGAPAFSFGTNGSATTNGTTVPSTPAKGGSLFDRIEKKPEQDSTTAQKPMFSFASTTPAADHTWKPESPIRFGGASTNGSTTPTGSPAKKPFVFSVPSSAATDNDDDDEDEAQTTQVGASTPKFNFGVSAPTPPNADKPSFFPSATPSGSASPAPSIFANLGKPSTGFTFGGGSSTLTPAAAPSNTSSIFASAATSRATTPGATTAEDTTAANTDAEDDAAPREAQRDMTALSAEELATEDVLFEQKSRCRKFVRGGSNPWENKGVGILRVLKNKESGNARVLMRLDPGGQVLINANVMKNKGMYEKLGDKGVKMVFAEGQGELSTYAVSFGGVEKALELLGKVQAEAE